MSFVHEDADFDALLQIVAGVRGIGVALVEKDYWVTHTLWALHEQGFDIWFKGGTSLSKGFGIIERFSEDLDLKLEPGTVAALGSVSNWKSEGTKATAERKALLQRACRPSFGGRREGESRKRDRQNLSERKPPGWLSRQTPGRTHVRLATLRAPRGR